MIRSLNQKGNAVLWIVFTAVIVGIIFMAARLGTPQVEPVAIEDVEAVTKIQPDDNVLGDPANTDLVLIEYSDFQCPACASYFQIIKQLKEEFGDQLTFVYRHFPLRTIHPNAQRAAQAAEAAGNQDKFFEFHDLLFERQADWSTSTSAQKSFEEYATELGLDLELFKSDVRDREVILRVNTDFSEAEALQVNSTPTFFLNGEKLARNPGSFDEFKDLLQKTLNPENTADNQDNGVVDLENGISVSVGTSEAVTEDSTE